MQDLEGLVVNSDQTGRKCKEMDDARQFETSSMWGPIKLADRMLAFIGCYGVSERNSISEWPCRSHCLKAPSNCHGGCFAFMNGAEQIARRNAISDQTRFGTGLLQGFGQCVVGNARRRPEQQADVRDVTWAPGENVAPREHAAFETDRLGRYDDLRIGLV